MRRIKVADLGSDQLQLVQVKARQTNLHGTGIIKPRIGGKLDMQPLHQWWQSWRTLWTVEERGRPSDQQVQPRKASSVDLIDELTQGIEGLLTHVTAHPLQGFDFVQHQHQPWVTGIPQNRQHALQEAQRPKMVDLTLDPRMALDTGRDVRRAREPGNQAVGDLLSITCESLSVSSQAGGKCGGDAGDGGEALFDEGVGAYEKPLGVRSESF